MIFRLEDYKDSQNRIYAMHCKTPDEAESFCNFLHSQGRTWHGGDSYIDNNYWEDYKGDTCYLFNKGAYDYIDYDRYWYEVLEWRNFMEDTIKEDKKSKGFVKEVFNILGIEPDEPFRIKEDSYKLYYKLTKELEVIVSQDIDFNKKRFSGCYSFYSFVFGEATIVKIPKITKKEQMAIDYARACGANWLAKDSTGNVYAYLKKPYRDTHGVWWAVDEEEHFEIGMDLTFLSLEDKEPYYIGGENE